MFLLLQSRENKILAAKQLDFNTEATKCVQIVRYAQVDPIFCCLQIQEDSSAQAESPLPYLSPSKKLSQAVLLCKAIRHT